MVDTIIVYRRLMRAAKRNQGTRLTSDEVQAILKDGAVEQAVRMADIEEEESQKEEKK